MVRYPEADRKSMKEFEQLRVRTGDGQERPLMELAEIDVNRGYSEINRVDQLRSITISADVEEGVGNADTIVRNLQEDFMPNLLAEFPHVQVRWEGQQEQTNESIGSLLFGTIIALLVMFFLLTLVFRSYLQPLLIFLIIPFGVIGAIFGHALMGLPITLFSFFGLVALTGVVVNDSIVLIDFINRRVRDGVPIDEALIDAGRRRFRPVLLTTLTTVAGLLPILLETSFQAQVLIPMANSLSFGLLLATGLILILVPASYRIYHSWFPPHADPEDDLPANAISEPLVAQEQDSAHSSENCAGPRFLEADRVTCRSPFFRCTVSVLFKERHHSSEILKFDETLCTSSWSSNFSINRSTFFAIVASRSMVVDGIRVSCCISISMPACWRASATSP